MSLLYPYDDPDHELHSPATVYTFFLTFIGAGLLAACAGHADLPPPAPPATEVLIPVAQKCEVAQVESSELETDDGAPNDIFGAVQQLLADLNTLKADREELQAANEDPCP